MNNKTEFNKINNMLNTVTEDFQNNYIILKKIEKTELDIKNMRLDLEKLIKELYKEEKDVKRLEKLSFQNFLHTIINDKQEKLDKEKLEVLQVKAKVDRLKYLIEYEEAELKNLNNKKLSNTILKQNYEKLLADKLSIIKEKHPKNWQEINSKYKDKDRLKLKIKEIKEAIYAVNGANDTIKKVKKSLNAASTWGTFDILGGGIVSTMAKRSHMQDTQNLIQELSKKLKIVNQELDDIKLNINTDLKVEGFLGMADYFLDNIFVDLAVQSKIEQARNNIDDVSNKINNLLEKLEIQLKSEENRLEEINKNIESSIHNF